MDPLLYSPRTYYLAVTDKFSEQKAKVIVLMIDLKLSSFSKVLEENLKAGEYSIVRVPRAREVRLAKFIVRC